MAVTINGSTGVQLDDNDKQEFGTGDDLQIYHDGSNSYIKDTGTGDLLIGGDANVSIVNAAASEFKAKFISDGAVELYYNNAKVFETVEWGARVKRPSGGASELDIVGAEGQDAELRLVADDGDDNDDYWRLLGDASDPDFYLQNYRGGGWETNIKATGNGNVELYYDNAKKFETTNLGAQITGELSLTTHLKLLDDQKVVCGAGEDLLIYHDSSSNYSYIDQTHATGHLVIRNTGADSNIYLQAKSGEHSILCHDDGAVELYYDGTKQFSTGPDGAFTSGGIPLRCGTSGPVSAELFTVQKNNGQVAYFDQSGSEDHYCVRVRNRRASGSQDATFIEFIESDGSQSGQIAANGSTTQYLTSSDYRLKENEVAISDGITRLKTLKPYRFNFKNIPDVTVDGFFAHEVTAVPEAIKGEKDGKEMQGLDYAKLTPLLTAALQEAITKIETLETENTKLQTDLTALTARVATLEAA